MSLITSLGRKSTRSNSEDRVEILRHGDKILIALADGAGGSSGGGEAADLAVETILERGVVSDPAARVLCLAEIDRRLSEHAGGETTAVAVVVSATSIVGASLGDSGAWLVHEGGYDNLASHQKRKPLLGSGVAVPVMFTYQGAGEIVLSATDGLLKYTSAEKICEVIGRTSLEVAPKKLIDLVRLRSGALQDDVALALCARAATRDARFLLRESSPRGNRSTPD